MQVPGVTDTYFQVFAGKNTAFPKTPIKLRDLTAGKGTSNTVLVGEAETAVPWTKPDDMPYDSNQPLPKLGFNYHPKVFLLMSDMSIEKIERGINESTLRSLIEVGSSK